MSYFQDTEDWYRFLLELVLSLAEILVLLRLYRKVYGKPRIQNALLYVTAVAFMMGVTCALRLYLHPIRSVSLPPVAVMCSLLYLWVYPPARQKKMLYSSIILTISCLWVLVWDLITTPIPSDQKNIFMIFALGHGVFWIMLEIIRWTDKGKSYKIPSFLWLLLASITLLSMAAFAVIEYYIVVREDPYLVTYEVPIAIVFLFINMSLFVFFDRFASLMQTEWENGLLEQQVRLQNRHYKDLEASHDKIRELHHEMNNYINTAARLAEQELEGEELKRFLTDATNQVKAAASLISTGNRYLDSILNIKLEELREIDCKLELDIHIPSGLKLSFEQTVTIMGNLLDNAAEALRKMEAQDRWLKLHLSYAAGALFIRVENSARKVNRWKEGLPETTKEDSKFHGLGLKNVRKVVDDLGTMEVESREESFKVKIVLYDR